MCDEEKLKRWAREGLSRRQFGTVAGAATLVACTPMGADPGNGETTQTASPGGFPAWTEEAVSFATDDGTMDGWFVMSTAAPRPGVILWPDIAGLRESKKAMARRLAGRGYSTLVVNQYYRDTRAPIWEDFADFAGNGGWDRARAMRGKLDAEAIMRDAKAAVAYLDGRKEIDSTKGIGTQGYCMGGPFAMWTAAAVPSRVKAAASFHGGGLVRDDNPMSPHRLFDQMDAALLIAIAQDDDAEAPDHKRILREAAAEADLRAEIEVYAGDHGWTVPDSPAYTEAAAEKAWDALMELYGAAL